MDIHTFIANYQEAFGQHAELPIAFWYSDRMGASTEKVTGCLFKCMKQVRDCKIVSLTNKKITLSLIHIKRCRPRGYCRSRWSTYN